MDNKWEGFLAEKEQQDKTEVKYHEQAERDVWIRPHV